MKFALALFKYFPYGGLQRNFLAIAHELIDRNHEIVIYTGHWEGTPPDNLNVQTLHPRGLFNHSRNRSFHHQLRTQLHQIRPHLLVGFNKMPNLDIYYAADTCFAAKATERKSALYRSLPRCRWSLRYEEAVFSPSSSTEILLLSKAEGESYRRYYQTPEKRFHLLPPGISRNRVRTNQSDQIAAQKRGELGLHPSDIVIIFLGSDYKRKGLSRLLTAIASLPDRLKNKTRLLIVGRDSRQPSYENQARQLSLSPQTRFLGERDDVPELLFASNLLVHPALSENTGNAILEALVAGVPVVCTATCGYSHYVQDHHLGIVTPEPFHQPDLNHALATVLAENRDWKEDCRQFTNSVDLFSRPQRAADIIESVASQHPSHATDLS